MATRTDKSGGEPKRARRASQKTLAIKPAVSPLTRQVSAPAKPPSTASSMFTVGSIRYGDITAFLRQLIMMLEAGTPLLRTLKTLSERGEKQALRGLISDMAQFVEMGNPLWQAFERHPSYFDTVFVNLIRASEASGTLVSVLQRLVDYRERREMLRKRVRAGMLYPAILVFACFGVVILIAKVIIPTFQDVFAKLQVHLAAWPRAFLAAVKFAGDYWWAGVLIVVGLALVYKLWYVRNPVRRITADRMKLRLPIVGNILMKNAVVEFTRTLSLLLRSGLSMMATLDLVRNAIHNRAFSNTLQSMRDSVERGDGLEQPMRAASAIIPPVVVDMLVTGEESGRLDAIADQVANTYEEEVDIAIAGLSDALQPILTVIIGVMVILLMLSVFVPLINMINQLGAGGA